MIKHLPGTAAEGNTQFRGSPNRHDRIALPSQSVTKTPSECPQGKTGSSSVHCVYLSLTCSLALQVTVEEFADNLLLNIFRHYLDASPQFWPRLAHICRRWRRIVFASQQALHLRLFCTHGTPVLKSLGCWPDALPIVVQCGGSLAPDPPASEDEDNIMAALKQFDRVRSISLTVTNPLLEKISTIVKPFSELESLVLLSQDSVRPSLPSAFRGGLHLRCLHLTGITSPVLLQLLISSKNLVDLQLHEVIHPRHFSPEALTNALSGMARLRSLSLHFLSSDIYLAPNPLSMEFVVLPFLSRLNFQGFFGYLEHLAARIDAPCLEDIEVTLCQSHWDFVSFVSFVKFIKRIKRHESHRRADILFSEDAVTIFLIQPGDPACLKLQLLRQPLREQLTFITRICSHFSAFCFNVEDLHIGSTRPSSKEDSRGRWIEFMGSFRSVKWFHIKGDMTELVNDLLVLDGHSDASSDWSKDGFRQSSLPSLRKLHLQQPGQRHAPLSKAVVLFMTSRRRSGHPIAVEYERISYNSELRGAGTTYAERRRRGSLTRSE